MAFDPIVFNRQIYLATTELVAQQIQLFNAASRGALALIPGTGNVGDYTMRASFRAIGNLVRRRNVYSGTDDVAAVRLQQLQNNSVKVASGTPPVEFETAQYDWILQNPELAALTIAEQLAPATLQDMLNTAISATAAAISGQADLNYAADDPLTFGSLVQGAGKFGDRQAQIAAWIMHSKSMTDLFVNAATNNERLFTYGTINVVQDPFGRIFVMTDSESLVSGDSYKVLGLVNGGVVVEQNDDFDSNMTRTNGKENIINTYQAQWSYNLGVYGYSWDTASGGHAPTNTAVGTAANWDLMATSLKDTAGVMITTTPPVTEG
jgi:hypothetical protein